MMIKTMTFFASIRNPSWSSIRPGSNEFRKTVCKHVLNILRSMSSVQNARNQQVLLKNAGVQHWKMTLGPVMSIKNRIVNFVLTIGRFIIHMNEKSWLSTRWVYLFRLYFQICDGNMGMDESPHFVSLLLFSCFEVMPFGRCIVFCGNVSLL